MGVTFKENVADIRNSKIIDTINKLKNYGVKVVGYDPVANIKEARDKFKINIISKLRGRYDAVIIAQKHKQYEALNVDNLLDLSTTSKKKLLVYDIKNNFPELKKSMEIIYRSL